MEIIEIINLGHSDFAALVENEEGEFVDINFEMASSPAGQEICINDPKEFEVDELIDAINDWFKNQ